MADHRNKTIEKRLDLPDKKEEWELFEEFDVKVLVKRYTPLADFLLNEYACLNSEIRSKVNEMMYYALSRSLLRYHEKNRHQGDSSFTFYFRFLFTEIMDDFIKEGSVYKITLTKIAPC